MAEQTMRAWRVHRYGRPSVALQLDDIPIPQPQHNEVLVRIRAAALNFNEIDGCHGRYLTINPPLPYTLGMEGMGEVVAAGPGAEQWLGRRVVASAKWAFGGYADYVIADIGMVFDAPAGLDDIAAAAFFYPFHLAWLGLHERGGLQRGETVLVHAGAGGVGSAAIQLAVAAGARVLATAGSPAKLSKCRELGAAVAIDYRATNFADAVLEATAGRGVDVVFDGVGGATSQQSLGCLAAGGRLLAIGFAGGIEAEDVPSLTLRPFLFGSLSLVGVMLAYAADAAGENPAPGIHLTPRAVGERVHGQLCAWLAQGRIKPFVGATVDFAQLPAALEDMEERRTMGRTVVVL